MGASLITVSLIGLVAISIRPTITDLLKSSRGEVEDGWWSDGSVPAPEVPPEAPPTEPGTGESAGWAVAPGGTEPVGFGTLYRYRIEVETATGLDAAAVATVVDHALSHPRGWINDGVAFQRVGADDGPVDMVIRLATPPTVDALCAPLETNGQVSCRNGSDVVLNLVRWETGVDAYAGNIEGYRIVLINHEVGHLLGHEHVTCPGPGRPAPVMMQVYYTGLEGCRPNLWPYTEDGSYIG